MSRSRAALIIIFAVAALVRLGDTLRPLDRSSWRESDIGSISRNFVREGMDPLYPRVDWRGTGPGYAEMEFPAYPWLIAVTYEIFGIHDIFARLWALAFSIGTLFFFFRLARENLSGSASIAAFIFFAFNPLILEASTAAQPEGLTILAYVAAAYYFLRWIRDEREADYWLAIAMTAVAILAKATAAHIGLLFAVLLFQKYGKRTLTNGRIWLFGLLTVIPAMAWYIHAKGLWTTYGNSLGVSNEYHWIGLDFFTNPFFISGILKNELFDVWVLFGMVVAAFGVIFGFRERLTRITLLWLASAYVFYVIAARTTAADWASYYHIFSVPAAALLFGIGIKKLRDFAVEWANSFSKHRPIINILSVAAMALVAICAFGTALVEARRTVAAVRDHRVSDASFTFAQTLRPQLREDGPILVSGARCVDDDGYPVAYNVSFMFYWLDRKGSNICTQEQSLDHVQTYALRGYKYFIAQRSLVAIRPGFEAELTHEYPVIASSSDFEVFDLTHPQR